MHGKQSWVGRDPAIACVCELCGKEYMAFVASKYCCGYHQTLARLRSGIDDEDRACPVCGRSFRCNKYLRKVACSRRCGTIIGHRRRRDGASSGL
jgi:hypothetical protein